MKSFAENSESDQMSIYGSKTYHLKFAYSNWAQTLGFLVWVEPFTSGFIDFQGKFDDPNWMFLSTDHFFETLLTKT